MADSQLPGLTGSFDGCVYKHKLEVAFLSPSPCSHKSIWQASRMQQLSGNWKQKPKSEPHEQQFFRYGIKKGRLQATSFLTTPPPPFSSYCSYDNHHQHLYLYTVINIRHTNFKDWENKITTCFPWMLSQNLSAIAENSDQWANCQRTTQFYDSGK